jgi:hypothetical protein
MNALSPTSRAETAANGDAEDMRKKRDSIKRDSAKLVSGGCVGKRQKPDRTSARLSSPRSSRELGEARISAFEEKLKRIEAETAASKN